MCAEKKVKAGGGWRGLDTLLVSVQSRGLKEWGLGRVPGRKEGHPPGGQSCLGWDSPAGLMTHRASSHSWGFLDDKFAEGPQSSAGTFPGAHRSLLAVALGLPAKPKAPSGLFLPHPYPSLLYLCFAVPKNCWNLDEVGKISRHWLLGRLYYLL